MARTPPDLPTRLSMDPAHRRLRAALQWDPRATALPSSLVPEPVRTAPSPATRTPLPPPPTSCQPRLPSAPSDEPSLRHKVQKGCLSEEKAPEVPPVRRRTATKANGGVQPRVRSQFVPPTLRSCLREAKESKKSGLWRDQFIEWRGVLTTVEALAESLGKTAGQIVKEIKEKRFEE